MNTVERWTLALRHAPALDKADWLWDRVRPAYNEAVMRIGRAGLERTINGTDRILVTPRMRGVTERYEPEVWAHLMANVRPGDTLADVGAFCGLYTVSLAKRVGPRGRVLAFEPDPDNFNLLAAQTVLNGVGDRVELHAAAVGSEDGTVSFVQGKSLESHVGGQADSQQCYLSVRSVRLDSVAAARRLDIIKIDVEGYEEAVLRGAQGLLVDSARAPRLMYIEVHPFAWHSLGTTSDSLLRLLGEVGYEIRTLDDRPVMRIEGYGEIVAHRGTGW